MSGGAVSGLGVRSHGVVDVNLFVWEMLRVVVVFQEQLIDIRLSLLQLLLASRLPQKRRTFIYT